MTTSSKYKIQVSYDGTQYGGWQIQPNATSVQALLEQALSTILQEEIALHGSGRTDAGVHALAQIAHFETKEEIDLGKTWASVNKLLPSDIRVMQFEIATPTFHARYSATGKIYHYRLLLGTIPDPFKRHYAYHVPHKVDLALLRRAALHFIGTHDFTSFANEATRGSAAKDAVRTLHRLDVIEEEGGARLEFEGDGFLY